MRISPLTIPKGLPPSGSGRNRKGGGSFAGLWLAFSVLIASLSTVNGSGIREGLAGHWPLDEKDPFAPGVFNRAAEAGEDGWRAPAVTVGHLSPVGTGYRFDETLAGESVVLGAEIPAKLNQHREFTFAAWVKPSLFRPGTGWDSHHAILSIGTRDLALTLAEGGEVYFRFKDEAGSTWEILTHLDDPVPAGQFSHVAVTRSRLDDFRSTLAVYLNGVRVGERQLNSMGRVLTGSDPLRLGRWGDRDDRNFNGVLSEVALWGGRALSDLEIAVLAASGRLGTSLSSPWVDGVLSMAQNRSGNLSAGRWVWSHLWNPPSPPEGTVTPGRHYWSPHGDLILILEIEGPSVRALMAEPWQPLRYEDWVTVFFPPDLAHDPAFSGAPASPAGDGVSNLWKYATGFPPLKPVSAEALPSLEWIGDDAVLTYLRSKNAITGLIRQVELANDLVEWTVPAEEEVPVVSKEDVGTREKKSVWIRGFTSGDAKGFARVRAEFSESAMSVSGVVAGWNFDGLVLDDQTVPQPPTTLDPVGQTEGLLRGSGLVPQGPNRSWGASGWGDANGNPYSNADAAAAAGKYFYFTIEPGTVERLSFTTLVYRVRRTSAAPRDFIWQYRIGQGEFADIGLPVHYSSNETDGRAQPPLDLAAIPSLQRVSEPVTFRLVAWNGTGTFSLGRDHGDSLTLKVEKGENTVSSVLRDGRGDFDPWNAERWAAWHENGKLVRPFELDTSVRFAPREDPWIPDLSGLEGDRLFTILQPGIDIDGNGLTIDVRPSAHRNRTLDQVYAGGRTESDDSIGLFQGFHFAAPASPGLPPTRIRNLTLSGFEQGMRTVRANTHPLWITHCVFTRNAFGTYFSSFGTRVENCHYFENGRGAFYAGSGSSGNEFINNIFRDNNYVINLSYGDMIFDTSHGNLVTGNRFQPSLASQPQWRVGISFYRNQGEDGRLREEFPRDNLVTGNLFTGYSLAVNVGARHGRAEHVHDLAAEGRDYAAYNRFEDNHIREGDLGIKINTSGNTIEGNRFENLGMEIVLHCVAYNLIETTINDQAGDRVAFWTARSDYTAYASRFPMQDRLMNSIPASEKLIHVRSDHGSPDFLRSGDAAFHLATTLLTGPSMLGTHSTGGTPIDFAAGNFHEARDGDEIAVIWDEPVSPVRGMDYHTILFLDSNGIEINRAGRSIHRWGGIAAGRFTNAPGHEVAVFPSEPIDGVYPVFVFRRGFLHPHHVLLEGNPHRIRAVAAGRFNEGEDLDGLAVIFEEGPTDILFLHPRDSSWSASAASPVRLRGVTAGHFDPSKPEETQLAAIGESPDPSLGSFPIYFFRAGDQGPFTQSAVATHAPWAVIGTAAMSPLSGVAVASATGDAGGHPLLYFLPGAGNPFRVVENPALAAVPVRLSSGRPNREKGPTPYDAAGGVSLPEAFGEMEHWGAATLFLPSAELDGARPVFWLATDPDNPGIWFRKTTSLIR